MGLALRDGPQRRRLRAGGRGAGGVPRRRVRGRAPARGLTGHAPQPLLGLRELNRATLARQLLLERSSLPVLDALEQVVALQSQLTNPPYVGLWTRLANFQHAQLTQLMHDRKVVRATMMRATLQLVSARDFLRLRGPLQPALDRAMRGFVGKRIAGLDLDAFAATARGLLDERPRGYGELGKLLLERFPAHDAPALSYASLRACVPVVGVPPGGTWRSASKSALNSPADTFLDEPLAPGDDPGELVIRYLAAFGPATVADVQTWSGLAGLREPIAALTPRLRTFRDEQGRELLDVPGAPLPAGDVPAPVRFMPEFDNLVLAHSDRSRVISDEHRRRVLLPGGRVLATILVDGFVAGTWKIERGRKAATLVIAPFERERLAADDREALEREGRRLLEFAEEGAASHAVGFV